MVFGSFLFSFFTHRWLCWVGLAQQGFCSHLRPSVLLSAMAATKRQHRALTLEKKIEVINDFDSGCFTKTVLATKSTYRTSRPWMTSFE
uniref:Putative secreted protein n=1 Tax=Ixodes ricinus TaxID=34613 RepID=A0A6B0U0B3_IXORI